MIYTGLITVRFVNIHFYRCSVLNVSGAMNVWLSEISSRLNQSGSAQVIREDIKYKLTIFCWVRCMNDVWLQKWSPEAAAGSPSRHFKDCEAAVILSAPVWSVLVTVTWHTEHSLTANPHKTKLYGPYSQVCSLPPQPTLCTEHASKGRFPLIPLEFK